MSPEFWGLLVLGGLFAVAVLGPASVIFAAPVCAILEEKQRRTGVLRRSRSRRKRFVWAAVIWLMLPVIYPVSVGPVGYAVNRGWLPSRECNIIYRPLWTAAAMPPFRTVAQECRLEDYFQFCLLLGQKHAAAE